MLYSVSMEGTLDTRLSRAMPPSWIYTMRPLGIIYIYIYTLLYRNNATRELYKADIYTVI
jgi:hypothetical protein